MRIVIETKGNASDAVVWLNDEIQEYSEFHLSINEKSGRVKLQAVEKTADGRRRPVSFYGGDFAKFDEGMKNT